MNATRPLVVTLLASAAFASGAATLLVPGLLSGPPAMQGSAKGTALVVALGGAPLLAVAYHRARAGSLAALALAAGAAAYLLYNGVLLVFATPFNRAFPLYEAMVGLAVWTFAVLVKDLWDAARQLTVPTTRWAAGFILAVVGLNVLAWLSKLIPALLSDHPRSMLAGTGLTTNPVYVEDLAFWLPMLVWVAMGMWQAHGPRTALGAAALCYWVLEAASVAVDQWWGDHADPTSTVVSSAVVPLFVVIGALTLWPLVCVLRTLRSSTASTGPARPEPAGTAPLEAEPPSTRPARSHARSWTLPARYVGAFFLWTSGIHVGIVAADPGVYRHFADQSLLPGLTAAWDSTFMAHPAAFGLVVAAGEALLAISLLGAHRWHRLGWTGTIAFHGALMCFGWGFWLWCVPALALLVRGARADALRPEGPGSSQVMTLVDHIR